MAHNKDRQQGFAGVGVVVRDVNRFGSLRTWGITGLVVVVVAAVTYGAYALSARLGAPKTEEAAAVASTTTDGATVELVSGDATKTANGTMAASGATGTGYKGASVSIAVLADPDLFDFANEKVRACDAVVLVPKQIAPTPRVLHAALEQLFADTFDYGFTPGNFVATQDRLAFERATIENGLATIYLTGSVGPIAGACDVPRIETQITETALQFKTVNRVQILLNGEPLRVE
ncbi:MAG: hypothetical protein RL150_192 [Candidatus Parcubacteria bacterium]|jgi:hypothetical protein